MIRMSAVVLFSFATLLLAAADRVKAGAWETTLTIGTGKPMVTKYCITDADARLMNGDLAALRKYLVDSTAKNTRGRCTVKSLELRDNRTTVAKLTCGKTEVVNTTTYYGDRYSSTSSNNVTVAGKRVGACPAK
jgi:hypothetical protein